MDKRKEYIELLDQLEQTKRQVAELIVKRDYQAFHKSALLEIDYMNKIGKRKDAVKERQYELNRIKRKIEILRNYPSLSDNIAIVDNQLDIEFEQEIKTVSNAKRRNDFLLVTEKFRYPDMDCPKELNEVYSLLVRKMHIIFNIDATDEEMQIWERVQSAYIKKDLEALRQLDLITVRLVEFVPNAEEPIEMYDEIEYYETILLDLEDECERKKQEFPFVYEELMDNEELLAKRNKAEQEKLEEISANLKIQQNILDALIQQKEG